MNNWIVKFIRGFIFAGQGIVAGFKERNMRIHAVVAIIVMMMGWGLNLSRTEWIVVLILIALMLAAELINTSIEELADVVKKKCKCSYEETRETRDLAAGAVLIMAIVSVVVGVIIFLPKLF